VSAGPCRALTVLTRIRSEPIALALSVFWPTPRTGARLGNFSPEKEERFGSIGEKACNVPYVGKLCLRNPGKCMASPARLAMLGTWQLLYQASEPLLYHTDETS
jgi:hypothetical protein